MIVNDSKDDTSTSIPFSWEFQDLESCDHMCHPPLQIPASKLAHSNMKPLSPALQVLASLRLGIHARLHASQRRTLQRILYYQYALEMEVRFETGIEFAQDQATLRQVKRIRNSLMQGT